MGYAKKKFFCHQGGALDKYLPAAFRRGVPHLCPSCLLLLNPASESSTTIQYTPVCHITALPHAVEGAARPAHGFGPIRTLLYLELEQ